ncbi:MAG: peptidylprolyl isomerase [Bryobacteraceae bacterium]|jgi:peptidyl-prolyl cis-trans isomerase A (cyclophilin A)
MALGAPLCLMLVACSTPDQTKKAEAPAAAKEERVPDVFQVNLDTSKGPVLIDVHRDWAPRGADHFYALVRTGFYDGNRFFRVVRFFVVQFGINGDPQLNRLWANANLPDDPVKQSNVKGTLTYAHLGPNSRSTQLFINLKDNKALDKQGFAPIGKVISGMDTVERFYSSYGEMAPRGQGPDPSQIEVQGNAYLENNFARLDYIKKAAIQ